MKMKPLNSCLSIFLLAQFLFWNGQAAGELLQARPRTSSLLTNLKAEYTVTRKNIKTQADLTSFKKTLDQLLPGYSLDIRLNTSWLDLFPANFFEPYNVIALSLLDCNMSSLPFDLICPIRSNELKSLTICNTVMASPELKLTRGGFESCTGLKELWLESVIQEVPSEAFRGLDKLKALTLQGNQIQRVDVGLEGLQDTLWYLNLGTNPISSIPKDTFKGWTKLTFLTLYNAKISTLENGTFSSLGPNPTVILSGNPLNCYDLQWLQEWYEENPIDTNKCLYLGFTVDPYPMCSVPCNVPLLSFDYEHNTTTCGSQQITSFGLLALLLIAISSYQI